MNFNQPVESNKDVKVNQEFTNKSTLNFKLPAYLSLGFPGDSVVKNLPAMQEMQALFLNREVPQEKEMATHSCTLAGKAHGQRSLTSYNPWGCKESDTT